jgi:sugar lactone lactonase YvrE
MDRKPSRSRASSCSAALLFLASGLSLQAAAGDGIADRVLGQRGFTTSFDYFLDGSVFGAQDLAFDRSVVPNRVYVADSDHNRVLGWSDVARFRSGAPADLVLGQPSASAGELILLHPDCPPPGASRFCVPNHLAVDSAGNLYVADGWNYRVLEFDSPFTTDKVADRVFGQASFTARQLPDQPQAQAGNVAVDPAGNLWMIDVLQGGRVVEVDAPILNDTRPDRTIENAPPGGCFIPEFDDMPCRPFDLTFSPGGDLVIGDYGGNGGRLLVLEQPLATDLWADFSLPATWPTATFDDAGNLYFLHTELPGAVPELRRFRAPVGPGSVAETVATVPFPVASTAQLATDGEGSIYAGYDPFSNPDSYFAVFDAPFGGVGRRIGRTRTTGRGFGRPDAVAIDRSSTPNHLYITDDANGRVLGWRDAAGFANGASADLVIAGRQPGVSCLPPSRTNFCLSDAFATDGLAVDSRGNLWLADFANSRVLELDRPFETDLIPDRVFGQGGSFSTGECNSGGRRATSLCMPGALAFDSQDNLYVADLGNNRVLTFKKPLQDDAADRVFGQAGFRAGDCNQGRHQPSASTLCLAIYVDPNPNPDLVAGGGLALDAQGNLYVADTVNTRVLIFRDPLKSDAVADRVLGQNNRFDTAVYGTGPRRFSSFKGGPSGPTGLAIGLAGELYVADTQSDRILVFDNPLARSSADRVLGHAGFQTPGTSFSGIEPIPAPSAANLLRPIGLAVDDSGNLFVADSYYNRVLVFDRQ